MIRIKGKRHIIEIPCSNPQFELSDLQKQLNRSIFTMTACASNDIKGTIQVVSYFLGDLFEAKAHDNKIVVKHGLEDKETIECLKHHLIKAIQIMTSADHYNPLESILDISRLLESLTYSE